MFPLPLTPFEYSYWCDDRPSHPTAFAFELSFDGPLEREALSGALQVAFARHPLLHARIAQQGRRPVWVLGSEKPPPIDWDDAEAPVGYAGGPRVDLTHDAGLRVWVRAAGSAARLRLQFHHACGDGLGALRFIEDLLLAYHALRDAPQHGPQLPPLAVERLPARGVFKDPAAAAAETWFRKLRDAWITAGHWLPLLLRPATPLAIPADAVPQPEEDPLLGYRTAALPDAAWEALRAAARASGATANDLLLAELLATLQDWNAAHGGRDGLLRINVPVSLRVPRDQHLPLANRLSFAFITRRGREIDDPSRLLATIAQETKRIRDQKIGLFFLGGLEVGALVPGMVRAGLARPHCFATIVLSNLGRVLTRTPLARDAAGRLVCGGVTLLRITAAPPVRPLTRAAIAVLQYGGETTINLRVDPTCLSSHEAERLLAAYERRLTQQEPRIERS